jgi:hypothetical protein
MVNLLHRTVSYLHLAASRTERHRPIRKRLHVEDELDKRLAFVFLEQNTCNSLETRIIRILDRAFNRDWVCDSKDMELRTKLHDGSPEIAQKLDDLMTNILTSAQTTADKN